MDEEMELIAATYKLQLRTYATLQKVLDDASYRKPSQQRIRAFRIERKMLDFQIQTELPTILKEILNLRRRLSKTAQVLRHNIEIAEESNSKAIMVFTIVTIVFLPLSFVAAVFGMNTSDIRDMNNDQGQFWKIAIPTTAAIGALSLFIAYGGPSMRALLVKVNRCWSKLRDISVVLKRPSFMGQRVIDEEITDDAHSGSLKQNSQPKRRRGHLSLSITSGSAYADKERVYAGREKPAMTSPERGWIPVERKRSAEKVPPRIVTPRTKIL